MQPLATKPKRQMEERNPLLAPGFELPRSLLCGTTRLCFFATRWLAQTACEPSMTRHPALGGVMDGWMDVSNV